ncbi:MAG: arylesterase [Gammaproteobacteria bacterium]|nr:arylesterase [Gammaproteobacteria bacterium]NNM14889.1 arylesterase [Gammaproteobacteria bacterium]
MQTVQAPALADDTLASVDIDSKTTTILDERKRILVLGDSLTAGYGIVLEKSWLHLLEQELNSSAENRYRLINAGISGDTTGGGLARLPQALEQHKPEVVIVELGGNDGLRGYPVKNIRDNLSKIIATVKATGAKVVLAGIQIPPNYGQRYTETFAAIYPQLAKEQNVPLIPFILDGVALKEEWMQQDGIHPNEDGQEQIKNNVLSSLTKVLE